MIRTVDEQIRKSQAHPADAKAAPLSDEAGLAVVELLKLLEDKLRALEALATEKLEALRAADAGTLERVARDEQQLLRDVSAIEQQQHALLTPHAQAMLEDRQDVARLTAVAEIFPEPARSEISARSGPLREIAENLQRSNRLAAAVAQRLHRHVHAIVQDIANGNAQRIGYGPSGAVQHDRDRDAWVDAVG